MSNPMQRNISQRKQVKSALERIQFLEENIQEFPRVVMAINEVLNGHGQRTADLASVVEAVVELFGASTVDLKIKEIQERKAMQRLETAKANLEAGLAKGDVVKADAVGEKSLVVGREFGADGEVLFPGRIQLQYSGIKPEFQAKLQGKGPGFTVDTDGGKFEILEVYDVVEKPAEPNVPAATEEAPVAQELVSVPVAETPAQLEEVLTPGGV